MNQLLKTWFSNSFLDQFNVEAKAGKSSFIKTTFRVNVLQGIFKKFVKFNIHLHCLFNLFSSVWDTPGEAPKHMFESAVRIALDKAKARHRWDRKQGAKLAPDSLNEIV
jgi:flagellar biosynthesis component FlhA